MTDFTDIKLGELLSHKNNAIKRNAIGILKQLQKDFEKLPQCPYCDEKSDLNNGLCHYHNYFYGKTA